jgi:adenine-specific DNA-methyltransferase
MTETTTPAKHIQEPIALADSYRLDATRQLDPDSRTQLGQFLTPAPVAQFMAALFSDPLPPAMYLLDAGAGIGSLTSAVIDEIGKRQQQPATIQTTLYEIDPVLVEYLYTTVRHCQEACQALGIAFESEVVVKDFINDAASILAYSLFQYDSTRQQYTHAILNPPYKKIKSRSKHRQLLRQAGIETSNLYTGFLALAIKLLTPDGELVAIVPRSFCNGPYFKPFRELLLGEMSLRQIHIFESRVEAFKEDDVLQENIILHAVKVKDDRPVLITASSGTDFDDLTCFEREQSQIVSPNDENLFIHIATNELEQHVLDRMAVFSHSLADLGVSVSTGPVVDFRVKQYLCPEPVAGAVPLIYPHHMTDGFVCWPGENGRKPQAIIPHAETTKWLLPNGIYTIVRRFSSKEERKRIVAAIYQPDDPAAAPLVGFENHLNVFHIDKKPLEAQLAQGLAVYLNASLVDAYFRQFNGHTQVNATDLKALPYPDLATLLRLGSEVVINQLFPTQERIDQLLEEVIQSMADIPSPDPVQAEQKIAEATEILAALGLPKAQQNDRSALTLLALLNLQPDKSWQDVEAPLLGITPIMDFCRANYGRSYAPNTRETFRRQTMHQFMEAGLAIPNPDNPNRPINSPKWCYQIELSALALFQSFGTSDWETNLAEYIFKVGTLREKYARVREMNLVPIRLNDGQEVMLSAGKHSELIKAIVESFAPRFTPGGELLYLGDTGAKFAHFEEAALQKLGVKIDTHGKMPDVVIHFKTKDWLVLVEAVTSHGPIDSKRRSELEQLFAGAKPGLVYVTAFPTKSVMKEYLAAISWETEVWVSASPSHLIHFDGERFLGPYDS